MGEAWTVDWSLLRFDVPLLALSLALLWTNYAVGGWFWSRTLPEFGESPLPVGLSAAIQLVANLGRYIPGSFAQVLGTTLLSRRAGLSPVRATAAAVAVQVVLLLAAFVVGLPAAFGRPAGLDSNRIQWMVSIALATALVAFLWFGGAGALVRWVLRRRGSTEGLPQGGGRRLLLWLPAYAVTWVVQGAAIVFLAQGLGMTIPVATGISAFAAAFLRGTWRCLRQRASAFGRRPWPRCWLPCWVRRPDGRWPWCSVHGSPQPSSSPRWRVRRSCGATASWDRKVAGRRRWPRRGKGNHRDAGRWP